MKKYYLLAVLVLLSAVLVILKIGRRGYDMYYKIPMRKMV